MLQKLLYISILSSGLLWGGNITIAVAANVSYAIDDLKKAFGTLYPDTKVKVILGSSGKLTAQIKNGAPFGLFMSANMKYPEALYHEGIAVTKPIVYARGSLAYFSSKKRDFTQGISLLKEHAIKKIAIANPKSAPYGKASVEAMKNANIYRLLRSKFVYAESISQTVSYAMVAADIGFVAKSSLFSPKMTHYKKGTHWMEVDPGLYTPINQGIVILREGKNNREIKAFYDFVLGDKAKEIMQRYGYLMP